jgi:hypothetical protein
MTTPAPSTPAPTDYRSEALLCAINTCFTGIGDLLARHPRAAQLRAPAETKSARPLGGHVLADLLWNELLEQERAALGKRAVAFFETDRGNACQFFQRRRRLAAWDRYRVIERRLPAPWPRLLELPPPAARELVINLGLELIARSLGGMSLHQVIHWLTPFGGDLAGKVIERSQNLRKSAPVPPTVANRWRDAASTTARHVTGDQIPAALGRGLLAALFRQLSPQDRQAATGLSRSSLPDQLTDDALFEPITPPELALAESITRELLGKPPSTPSPARGSG